MQTLKFNGKDNGKHLCEVLEDGDPVGVTLELTDAEVERFKAAALTIVPRDPDDLQLGRSSHKVDTEPSRREAELADEPRSVVLGQKLEGVPPTVIQNVVVPGVGEVAITKPAKVKQGGS
jgi:hypothetical protein